MGFAPVLQSCIFQIIAIPTQYRYLDWCRKHRRITWYKVYPGRSENQTREDDVKDTEVKHDRVYIVNLSTVQRGSKASIKHGQPSHTLVCFIDFLEEVPEHINVENTSLKTARPK